MSAPGAWPSHRYLFGAGATLLLLWGTVRLLGAALQPIFLVLIACLLAFLVHYPIDFLDRWMPRALATVVTLLLFLAGLGGVGWWLVPRLYEQAAALVASLPAVLATVGAWWEEVKGRGPLAALPRAHLPETVEQRLLAEVSELVSGALPLALGTVAAVMALVFVLGVAFFLAYRPDLYVGGLLRLVPPRYEASVAAFLHRLGHVIRGWIVGALVSMTTVGILTAVGTRIIGLDTWLVLAVIAFALEIVPYAGPILSAVPAVGVALAHSPGTAIQTALLYLFIQQVEGNAVTPIVMKRAIELPPALLLLWQVAMVSAFGALALFVAAPLLAVVMVAVDHFWVRGTLGKE